MKKHILLYLSILLISFESLAQCENIFPNKDKIEEFGNPTEIGIFKTMHRGLKFEFEKFGCPIKKPKPITNYVAITKENALRRFYEIESSCKESVTCISVIIIVKGWEYEFSNRDKPYRIYTGEGEAKGIVYKTSNKTINQLIKTSINGTTIQSTFGGW